MRPRRVPLVAVALLLVPAGCADSDLGGGTPAQPTEPGERRYQETAMVLESPDHGPELCLGVVLDSFPRQCGGLPIPNWRWDRVEGEQASGGTTWGSYQVVGAYDVPMGGNVAEDPGEFVLNVAFTGDLARHRAELRPRWGGRLCVAQQPRTYRQLQAIQRELQGEVARELGLRSLARASSRTTTR